MFFTGTLAGLDMMWVFGDEFVSRNFTEYYRHVVNSTTKEKYFGMQQYEVQEYSTTRYASSIKEIIPRLLNLIAKAIIDNKYLPKVMMIITDDDVLKQVKMPNPVERPELEFILEYFLEDVHRTIREYKEKLEVKCKHEHYPHVILIMPPCHKYFPNNEQRDLFTDVMEEIIQNNEAYSYICCLRLKKCWDERDGAYYLRDQRRFTPIGLTAYWSGVDEALKFWSRTLYEVLIKKLKKNAMKTEIAKRKIPVVKSKVTKVTHHDRKHSYNYVQRDRDFAHSNRSKYTWRKSHHSEIEYEKPRDAHNVGKHESRRLPKPPRRH